MSGHEVSGTRRGDSAGFVPLGLPIHDAVVRSMQRNRWREELWVFTAAVVALLAAVLIMAVA